MVEKIQISKINGEWHSSYLGEDKCYHYLAHGKTKDDLIKNLSEKFLEQF